MRPHPLYALKLFLGSLIGLVFPGAILSLVLSSVAQNLFSPWFIGVGALIVIGVAIVLHVANLQYEITADEVIVYSGVLNKVVRHVPFRTITNLEVRRDLLDRLIGLGSLSIQTAGAGSFHMPEERLVGMRDIQSIYDYVAREMRRFRSGMSPTQSESDGQSAEYTQQILLAILQELQMIRAEMQRTAVASDGMD
jgi:uncharacterized membrane protein YdbT with pleckstrin-like domain